MGGRVLWIEDNRDDITFLTAAVAKVDTSIQIDAYTTGEEAQKHLNSIRSTAADWPALILLDLNLPGRSGHDVLAELKADREFRGIPVIVLTTSRSELDRQRAIDNHANAYVVKPHDFREYESFALGISNFWLRWSPVRLDPRIVA